VSRSKAQRVFPAHQKENPFFFRILCSSSSQRETREATNRPTDTHQPNQPTQTKHRYRTFTFSYRATLGGIIFTMSYAYLFKYIIIGDTGKWFRSAFVCGSLVGVIFLFLPVRLAVLKAFSSSSLLVTVSLRPCPRLIRLIVHSPSTCLYFPPSPHTS